MSDELTAFIQDLCHFEKFGGRCMRKEFGVWEVLDISAWSEEQSVALHQRFPSVSARVEANRKSLGGFSVLLHQERGSRVWTALLVCAVMVSVVLSLAQFVKVQSM